MFLKTKSHPSKPSQGKKEALPSVIAKGTHILGNIINDGVVDFDGTLEGNMRCETLTIRPNGVVKGEVTAENIFVYGKVNGLIRAKNVHLHSTCHIEGIVMHESLSIEDGAFIDGKCKRTNKPTSNDSEESPFEDESQDSATPKVKVLENIRLIR